MTVSPYYVLGPDGEPVSMPDVRIWGEWFKTADRHLALTVIGPVRVSTVFLGIDHAFGGPGPVLWETLIFGGLHDGTSRRYQSRADALLGHALMVGLVRDL